MARGHPARCGWARGVGEDGWAQLAQFVRDGGSLVGIGDGADTADALLDLPISDATPDEDELTAPGVLLDNTFDPTTPAAWGMPEQWPVWFYDNAAYEVESGADAQVAGSYPATGEILASGYADGEEALAGLANVVSFEVGEGSVTVAGGEITFRSWPRAALPVLFNSLYHGPSEPADSPSFATR